MITTLMNRLNTLNKLALYGLFLFFYIWIHIYNGAFITVCSFYPLPNNHIGQIINILFYVTGYLPLGGLIYINFRLIQRTPKIERFLLILHILGCTIILPFFWLLMLYEGILFNWGLLTILGKSPLSSLQ